MVRSEGLLACVVLLLSVPTVATLQLPRAAGPGLRPGPHASRAQRQQLSRGDVLRGALAVAATWASPHADSVRPVRTGCAPYAHRNGLLRALSAEAQGFVTVPALGVPYRTHTQPTLSGAPRVPPLAGRAGTDHTLTLALTKTQASPLAGSADDAAPAAEALKADGIPDKIIGEVPASGLIFKLPLTLTLTLTLSP